MDAPDRSERSGGADGGGDRSVREHLSRLSRRDLLVLGGASAGLAGLGVTTLSEDTGRASGFHTKRQATYYTDARRENARENVERHEWARQRRDQAVSKADRYLEAYGLDGLWTFPTGQRVSRSWTPNEGEQIHAGGEWTFVDGRPFEITNGEWTLPTNDFEAYRRSGLDDRGFFDPELADDSLLVNEEHPEMGREWGVDDGYGFIDEADDLGAGPGTIWVPVAFWNLEVMWKTLLDMVRAFRDAYVYAGNQRYARAGTVLLDRIADVYPDLDLSVYRWADGFQASHGFTGEGKWAGSISAAAQNDVFTSAYDGVFPGQSGDGALVSFLAGKAEAHPGLANKDSLAAIRRNIEQRLVAETLPAVKDAQLRGNFGHHQSALAMSAVVMNESDGYTAEALEFLFRAGEVIAEDDGTYWGDHSITGGDVKATLLDEFDRDGMPNESSPHYNRVVFNNVRGVADSLREYDRYEGADLYGNVKFERTVTAFAPLIVLDRYVPSIGDSGRTGSPGIPFGTRTFLAGYEVYDDPRIAKLIYHLNGGNTAGLRGDIFDEHPGDVDDRIRTAIDAEGPLDLLSTNQAGYGLGVLRDGQNHRRSGEDTDDLGNAKRAIWLYYGRNSPDTGTGHTHGDALNLGVMAHDLDLAPDLGYPATFDDPIYHTWLRGTVSHNTVLVDEERQHPMWVGTPHHFDHTDRVQFVDVDARDAYPQTEEYRRTTAMVRIDEADSYAVDFFRVVGGDDHHFSFHGGPVPGDRLSWGQKPGVSEMLVESDGGGFEPSRSRAYTGEWSVRLHGPSNAGREARILSVETVRGGLGVDAYVNAAVSGDPSGGRILQGVYLGRDVSGFHACLGVGAVGEDDEPRLGIYYPKRETWGEHVSVDGWQTGTWYRLAVSTSEASVYGSLSDAGDERVLVDRTFDLDASESRFSGIFGDLGADLAGSLYFDGFTLDGDGVEFYDVERTERTGVATNGLDLAHQGGGTYAGESIPFGSAGWNEHNDNAFNYLDDIEWDNDPARKLSLDWDIEDHWDARAGSDVHLRLTTFGEFEEVALADGRPPRRAGNPNSLRYVLVHRAGSGLESVFTSVVEPYERERFVERIDEVTVESDDPTARAVRVELASGRTDYVASALRHDVEHTVGDAFTFAGALAVYSRTADGGHEHAYLNDGTHLVADGDDLVRTSHGRFEGSVTGFTRDLSRSNELEVAVTTGPRDRDVADTVGEWLYVRTDNERNGAYQIKGVARSGPGSVTFDVGKQTTVRGFVDSEHPGEGYRYVPEVGADVTIPIGRQWQK